MEDQALDMCNHEICGPGIVLVNTPCTYLSDENSLVAGLGHRSVRHPRFCVTIETARTSVNDFSYLLLRRDLDTGCDAN